MNFKSLPASILIAIGGLLILASSIPLICDFFPILTFPNGQLTFWGTRLPNRVTITQINGWTLIGFAGYEVAAFYMLVGAVALLVAFNTYQNVLPVEDIKGIPINSIASIVFGILDLGLILLIYIAPIDNPNGWGFSPLSNFTLLSGNNTYNQSGRIIGATLGIGFLFLVVGAVLIILGGLINFVLKPSTSSKAHISA